MNIEKNTISFKSKPYYFEKEKSGSKTNTVRILNYEEEWEIQEAIKNPSKYLIKISNGSGQSFLRRLKDITRAEFVVNKITFPFYVFSWTHP